MGMVTRSYSSSGHGNMLKLSDAKGLYGGYYKNVPSFVKLASENT